MIDKLPSLATVLCLILIQSKVGVPPAAAQQKPPPLSNEQLLTEIQRRACLYFWECADPKTGLTNDRAKNRVKDDNTAASVSSTGYALAALPIAVEHKWVTRKEALKRAEITLRFLVYKSPQVHGWFYHWPDRRTGLRGWNCEVSTIDTALLVAGALMCGQYFHGTEVERLANSLYDRLDWDWVRTNGGAKPNKLTVSHGWKPETGFLPYEWDRYCELKTLYILGLGARKPLRAESWTVWERTVVEYKGRKTLGGGPIFFHEMAYGYWDFRDQRDKLGWDYWVSALNGIQINRQYCIDNIPMRRTYFEDIWGLNANDAPDGYRAYSAPGSEDGTVSPTGAVASIMCYPDLATRAANTIYSKYADRLWGRYGFGNAFNVDRNWYDPDVIGIDLGMVLLAIENHRTGLPWKLMAALPATQRAWKRIGFRRTKESLPRPIFLP